jgi:hypothetical protein
LPREAHASKAARLGLERQLDVDKERLPRRGEPEFFFVIPVEAVLHHAGDHHQVTGRPPITMVIIIAQPHAEIQPLQDIPGVAAGELKGEAALDSQGLDGFRRLEGEAGQLELVGLGHGVGVDVAKALRL